MKYSTLKPRMLLHSCCATCAAFPIDMLGKSFDIILFYYNPNISSEEEYIKRYEDIKRLAENTGVSLLTEKYDRKGWIDATKSFQNEPEGGKRCDLCFKIRLEKTAVIARQKKFDIFATTLSISPHKDFNIINATGKKLADQYSIEFYSADLKKKDGFKKTIELSREYGFYRQNYCGCEFSIRSNPD